MAQENATKARSHGVYVGMTERYAETASGLPVVALKSYFMSPFVNEAYMHDLLFAIRKAREQIAEEHRLGAGADNTAAKAAHN